MKHRFCAAALAAVLLLSAAPLSPAASAAFSDAEGTWATEVIEKAEGYGLMNGYPDGTFGVGKELTRGEFVAVLCRMFGWDAASPSAPSFSDCPASHWAYSYVETALAHGVMDAGGAFRPEDYISREEMAVMLVRAMGYGTIAGLAQDLPMPFRDVTTNVGYIAMAHELGLVNGTAATTFSPDQTATREQAAVMLIRLYDSYHAAAPEKTGIAYSAEGLTDLTGYGAVAVGGARLTFSDNGALKGMRQLSSVNLTGLTSLTATAGSSKYALAEDVMVLLRDSGQQGYYPTTLSAVNSTDYSLVGWYDNQGASAGGRIRILVATKK